MDSVVDRAPGSTASLRVANQQRVLAVLREPERVDADAVTQAALARITGLAPATVSNIVRELSRSGVVETTPGSGRRGTVVRLARGSGLVVGVDFGHTHVAVALGDLTGTIISRARQPLPPDHAHDQGVELASELVGRLLAHRGSTLAEVRSIGLGLPVPIERGVVQTPAILPGWVGVTPQRVAQERWGCPVYVDNDANLGALAEHRLGVARGHDDVVFVKVSSGIGAGIVLGNEVFHGSAGTAGEIGHLTFDDQGPVCRCGSRGCLEAYASTLSVQSMLADQLPGSTFLEIVAAAEAGNVSARRTIEDTGLHLGWGLASIANLVNPSLIVVGGEMARAGELLLAPVRSALRRHALATVATTPVLASALGEDAFLTGAVLFAADRTNLLEGEPVP